MAKIRSGKKTLWRQVKKNRWIYLFLFPGFAFILLFCYVPMYGLTLAFKDFKISAGILGSPWASPIYKNFVTMWGKQDFWAAFLNTFRMGFWYIVSGFPVPIILAMLLNEMRFGKYKKVLQTVYTFPNFLSWVIVGGLMTTLFSSEGFINTVIAALGGEKYSFLTNSTLIRPLLYGSNVWKGAGWSAILYLAAISGISPELYEAAEVDGANRFQRMFYITWPGIKATAVILLILAFGGIMNNGFDQILNMVNPVVQDAAENLDTYIYRKTFKDKPNYGFSTAIGLAKSVINFTFLLAANKISKLFGESGVM